MDVLDVSDEVAALGGLVPALPTLVRPLPRVDAHVAGQVPAVHEGLAAVPAAARVIAVFEGQRMLSRRVGRGAEGWHGVQATVRVGCWKMAVRDLQKDS